MFLVGALEILITAAGVALVFFTLRAARASASEARRAADAASEQADTMNKTLKQGADTSERQLRAYFHVEAAQPFQHNSLKPACPMNIKNVGRTPAYGVTIMSKVCVLPYSLLGPILPEYEADDIDIMGVISPGAILNLVLRPAKAMEIIDLNHIRDDIGIVALFVFGEILYRDAFGIDRFHKFKLWSMGENARTGRLQYCLDGNEAN